MAWIYLILAGVCEIGWPIGLKWGWTPTGARPLWIAFAVACMAISGAFLFLAQRVIPMGTAYAVWTGIGAVGTLAMGIALFGDATSMLRLASAGLIIAGVVGLKFA